MGRVKVCRWRSGAELLLDGGAGLAVLGDEVGGEEESEGGEDGGACGNEPGLDASIAAGARERAEGKNEQGGGADGKRGELRQLLAEDHTARGPGKEDD